jgi:hypothetical protein
MKRKTSEEATVYYCSKKKYHSTNKVTLLDGVWFESA